ncbi:MAG: DUF2207 domain-containing protein, partial [Candidatus Altiarchaeota archaeon]|nr:DUF2207 domain-containing protein [Candidatus Altiarchaeota archaeon]
MSEQKRLAAILIFPFLVLFLFTALTDVFQSYSVAPYYIDLTVQGDSLIVSETLTYDIKSASFHELYRSYELTGPMSGMEVLSSSCPPDTRFRTAEFGTTQELICRSEAGYESGKHAISFSYEIPRPYDCYDDGCELFWTILDSFDSDISDIQIRTTGSVDDIISFPAGEWVGDVYHIKKLPKGSLLELRVQIPAGTIVGNDKPGQLAPAVAEYASSSARYTFIYNQGTTIVFVILLLEALILSWIYLVKGKDKDVPGIPEVLHYVPSDKAPYEVDFLFNGRVGDFGEHVIEASLLDLAKRKYVKLTDTGLMILKDTAGLSGFESRLLQFYIDNSQGGTFNSTEFEKRAKKLPSWEAQKLFLRFKNLTGLNQELKQKRVEVFDR